jgi:hypothetical protein
MAGAGDTPDTCRPQTLHTLGICQEHCLETGTRGDLLFVGMVPKEGLIRLPVAEVPQPIIDDWVASLAGNIAINQPKIAVLSQK